MVNLQKQKEKTAAAFFMALGIAALLFLPFLLYDKGYFIYYGDFNVQQISFYMHAHDAVRAGNFGWDFLTDLGANFIGSYSFYLLGSPFFWLTIPFPTAVVPYLMAPLLMLKLAFASLTAYLFLRQFVRPSPALLGALLYAFSGFSVYNIFFNHFHEALIWFPLMLWALERYMRDGKRGIFALTVLISALSNYYFFIGQAIFLLLYWFIRLISGGWKVSFGKIFWLFFEAIIGTAGAAILLLPSYYAVIQNSRVDAPLSGWNLLIYSEPQRLWDIIHSFFFPQDSPARPNFFPDANNKWASMSAWIPLLSCTGVLAYMQSRRHTDWLRRLLIVLFMFALIPGLNAVFQLFNSMYYARWFYMLVLVMILATVMTFDQAEEKPVEWKRACGWVWGITAFFSLFIGLVPASLQPNETTGKMAFGLYKDQLRFWVYVAIAGICLLLTTLLLTLLKKDKRLFYRWTTGTAAAIILIYSWYMLGYGKITASYDSKFVITRAIRGGSAVTVDQSGGARMDVYDGMDNLGLFWGRSCIQTFHSIVPGSVMEFYPSVGVTRTVGSRPDSDHYALRSFLSVRWLLDYANEDALEDKNEDDYFEYNGKTAMPDYTYREMQNGYKVYENTNYIPMGFLYESYLSRSEYEQLTTDERELVLLKALVVEDADVTAASGILPHLNIEDTVFDEETYRTDCKRLQDTAATTYTETADGFLATNTTADRNLLFFSVPYESGWSATVNGSPATIHKASIGFMAVECPAGENTIVFTYRTPGLLSGIYISGGAALLLLAYLLGCILTRKKAAPPADDEVLPEGEPVLPEGEPVLPEGEPVLPEGEPVLPEGEPVLPEGEPVLPDLPLESPPDFPANDTAFDLFTPYPEQFPDDKA